MRLMHCSHDDGRAILEGDSVVITVLFHPLLEALAPGWIDDEVGNEIVSFSKHLDDLIVRGALMETIDVGLDTLRRIHVIGVLSGLHMIKEPLLLVFEGLGGDFDCGPR